MSNFHPYDNFSDNFSYINDKTENFSNTDIDINELEKLCINANWSCIPNKETFANSEIPSKKAITDEEIPSKKAITDEEINLKFNEIIRGLANNSCGKLKSSNIQNKTDYCTNNLVTCSNVCIKKTSKIINDIELIKKKTNIKFTERITKLITKEMENSEIDEIKAGKIVKIKSKNDKKMGLIINNYTLAVAKILKVNLDESKCASKNGVVINNTKCCRKPESCKKIMDNFLDDFDVSGSLAIDNCKNKVLDKCIVESTKAPTN